MRISAIGGSGYVGLITGLGLAELGNKVVNVDIDSDKVELLNQGRSPIYEKGIDLNEVLQRNLREGRIKFTTDLQEGVRHGKGLYDFFNPTRIVIGADSEQASGIMRQLYAPFTTPRFNPEPRTLNVELQTDVPIVETDIASAQMVKYASNAFLATRISFINEIASICERVGS